VKHPCCRHCPDDPGYHADNPRDSHDTSCLTCDRDVAGLVLAEVLAEFWRRADPSTTGVWREACELLDSIVTARLR